MKRTVEYFSRDDSRDRDRDRDREYNAKRSRTVHYEPQDGALRTPRYTSSYGGRYGGDRKQYRGKRRGGGGGGGGGRMKGEVRMCAPFSPLTPQMLSKVELESQHVFP
jgi:hypothetical protein